MQNIENAIIRTQESQKRNKLKELDPVTQKHDIKVYELASYCLVVAYIRLLLYIT